MRSVVGPADSYAWVYTAQAAAGDHDQGRTKTLRGGPRGARSKSRAKMFASARKIEEGGSLTILATALVDTGSRMDELIFQEFKRHW